MDSKGIKERLSDLGADLCGIASIDRFGEAPEGFHPRDVLSTCESVIVFAKRFLAGTLMCQSTVPYTIVRNRLSAELDRMAVLFCTELEQEGIIAIPTGAIGPTEWDKRTQRFRNIISAKHAAEAAGLGVIGKNSLLITPEYGNMVWLAAIITDVKLEPDQLLQNTYCTEKCNLCRQACPIEAIKSQEMEQLNCWEHAFGAEDRGDWKIKCYKCRTACPYVLGTQNKKIGRIKA